MKKIIVSILILPFFASLLWAGQPPQVAGSFYPAGRKELGILADQFLGAAESSAANPPQILIAPHAGYDYSGAVAGRAFREIKGKSYEVVIVLGVAHQAEVPSAGAAMDPKGFFETPLGKIPVDQETAARLLALTPKIQPLPQAFQGEHSVEVELPFLQRTLPDFKIVPLVMNRPDLAAAKEVGEAIASVIKENEIAGKRTLLVVSTDFSHYPSRGEAQVSDAAMIPYIESVDPEGLFAESQTIMNKKIPNLVTVMCGEAGVLAGLYTAKALGISKGRLLSHATSGDVAGGDKSRVVGYAAFVFYPAGSLTEEQKKQLLQTARKSLKEYFETGKTLGSSKGADEFSDKPQAVFVTLRENGELRGCVGTVSPQFPLKQAVMEYAIAAATQDPRFPPVEKEEWDKLKIEISILSPQRLVSGPDAIVPGLGVVLIQGNHTGIFLPEVWKETGWSKEKFLSELASQKAGLPADAWKDPKTKLYVFTAAAFSE